MPFIADAAIDALLAYVADSGTRMDITSAEATTYTEATSTNTLGNVTLTAGDGNGDYTIADGDTNGRKLTVAAQTIASASGTGTATSIAITDGVSELLFTTTLSASQAVTSGNQVDIAAFDHEVADSV